MDTKHNIAHNVIKAIASTVLIFLVATLALKVQAGEGIDIVLVALIVALTCLYGVIMADDRGRL